MNLKIKILISALIIFDVFIWQSIIFAGPNKNLEAYFLNVGQGDSELVVLPGNVKILIDGGPNNKILENLSKIFSPTDRYIDLVILSHPQTDHFNGLIDVFKRYKVGAFIFNGEKGVALSWQELAKSIKENKSSIVVLKEGDKIKYQKNILIFLSPGEKDLKSNDPNETALVSLLENNSSQERVKILFTGDISFKTEKNILDKYNIKASILKISHHGSKYSTSEEFLKAVNPKISVIEVGKNSYGHPTKEVLSRLASVESKIFRTDKDGLIKIEVDGENIKIFKIP